LELLENAPKGLPVYKQTKNPEFPDLSNLKQWLDKEGNLEQFKQWLKDNDPANAEKWPSSRSIRAELLILLMLDEHANRTLKPFGVIIGGVRIEGSLDFSFSSISKYSPNEIQ
jgi:hypothetical protein